VQGTAVTTRGSSASDAHTAIGAAALGAMTRCYRCEAFPGCWRYCTSSGQLMPLLRNYWSVTPATAAASSASSAHPGTLAPATAITAAAASAAAIPKTCHLFSAAVTQV
jgi:hypothetical protein